MAGQRGDARQRLARREVPAVAPSPARRAYLADLAIAADRVLDAHGLDDFSQATPAVNAEHIAAVNAVKRRHGVPITS